MNALFVIVLLVQATQPVDPTMDWLLDQSTPATPPATQPATAPTTLATSPFAEQKPAGERAGTIILSDGTELNGGLSTTPGKPIRVWDDKEKQYLDLPFESIARIEAKILWERDEPEWRFKASGQDEKVFTGKTYPAREMAYTFTLANGDTIVGQAVAPVYVRVGEKTTLHVLHKRDKGAPGATLAELVYVKRVAFAD